MKYVYETVVIFKPHEYEDSKKKLEDICRRFRLLKKEDLGVKKLAYPLREEKFTEGYYSVFTWAGTPENVAELERNMRIDDNILKFITVRREEDDITDYPEEDVPEYPNDVKSEQRQPIDALDVLLGFADYKKEVV